MAFTFNASLPNPLDRVRQLIGDTDSAKPQFPDETIDAMLVTEPTELRCAYLLALDLAAKYSRLTEVTVDHQQTRNDLISKNYLVLADRLLARLRAEMPAATVALAGVFVMGIGDDRGPYDLQPLPRLCQ